MTPAPEIGEFLDGLHSADISDLLEVLGPEDRKRVFKADPASHHFGIQSKGPANFG